MSKTSKGSIADQIIADLTALSVDAKRKNPEIKHACDHSIEITKPFSSNLVSQQKQIKNESAEMARVLTGHPEFIVPFLMACNSKNSKLIQQGVKGLSKIIQLKLLPTIDSTPEGSPDPLISVIDSLTEALNSGNEIQVKILQLLPSFFQLYSTRINNDSLGKLLNICTTLQTNIKSPIIVNTSQATFSQLINIAFEKVSNLDASNEDQIKKYDVSIGKEKLKKVGQYEYDVQRIVEDICLLIDHKKPKFLKIDSVPNEYGFEILENLIKNNSTVFSNHEELSYLLGNDVSPILFKYISTGKDYKLVVNASRLVLLLLTYQYETIKSEAEMLLKLTTHILAKESGSPTWKKTIVLEIYLGLFKNADILPQLFKTFNSAKEKQAQLLTGFLETCFIFVNENRQILNTGDLIQRPLTHNDNSKGSQRSHQTASQKKVTAGLKSNDFGNQIKFIESIDKSEPPEVVDTYNLYLITQIMAGLSDCIQGSTVELLKKASPLSYLTENAITKKNDESLKYAYDNLHNIMSQTWRFQLDTANIFIHSTLDKDFFSIILKVLENTCYCAGIMAMNEIQHSILEFLGVCTLRLDGRNGYQSKVMSISESIVGTISSTLGHAVSNISNHSNVENANAITKLYPRNINNRQTICFHTLLRLAVSLGSHLNSDWKIILITIQWMSYYIDGPTGFNKKDIPALSPYLENRDLKIIEHSLNELNKSISNGDAYIFTDVVEAIIVLSDNVMADELVNCYGETPVTVDGDLQPCVFNKLFYINKLTDICDLNPFKLLVQPDKNLELVNGYFSKIAKNRSFADETRILSSRSFNSIAFACAEVSFEKNPDEDKYNAEIKILTSMCGFMIQLSKLPLSKEIYTANCEAEMCLRTLDTLKTIIDRYGSMIHSSWDIITEMLDFPFSMIKNCDKTIIKEKIINDIVISILKSSFETLKVILDEILQGIPKAQIKVIIDTLYKFVDQNFDLNISFNSVSYFWLISDFIKDKLDAVQNKFDFEYKISSEDDLIATVISADENEYIYYNYLWIYLVLQLAKTTSDPRVQVRNGAIITTFNVIESFSSDTSFWSVLYEIVISPVILKIQVPEASLGSMNLPDQNDWSESFINISNGVTKLMISQLNISAIHDLPEMNNVWSGIIKYFIQLLNLDYNWIDVNTQVFKNYHDILDAFNKIDDNISNNLLESLFEPWSYVKINYNLNHGVSYQASLCQFIQCFKPSFELFTPIMNSSKFEKMLTIFNSCIRYPILVDSRNDDKKCTMIQQAVLDNLAGLSFDNTQYSFESLLIQQLNLIIVLPFQTRDLIVKKLGNKGIKIPTFIAASFYGLQILQNHLPNINDVRYLNDRTILKVVKSLLELSKSKSDIIVSKPVDSGAVDTFLWMESFEMLVNLLVNTLDIIMNISDNEFSKKVNMDSLNQLFPLCLSTLECCLAYKDPTSVKNYFDFKHYNILKNFILKLINNYYKSNTDFQISKTQIEQFLSHLWKSSFYYDHDSLIKSILEKDDLCSVKNMKELTRVLIEEENWDIYGSTAPVIISLRLQIAKQCFEDIFDLTENEKNPQLYEIAIPFFVSRCALGLRKFLMDSKLLGTIPITRVQIVELEYIVEQIEILSKPTQSVNAAKTLYPMLVQLISIDCSKDLKKRLQDISMRLNE